MPTGYTAAIKDGITFKQYALSCARNFGALIEMRDDPMDAPIPKAFKPSDYHSKAVDQAKARKAMLRKMSIAQCESQARKDFNEREASIKKSLKEKAELKAKYEAMLSQVESYIPPSKDHDNLKKFMRDQITQSIEFDCSGDYYERELSELGISTPTQWRNLEIDKCDHDIRYHTEKHTEEVKRTDGRNDWIKLLRQSLQ